MEYAHWIVVRNLAIVGVIVSLLSVLCICLARQWVIEFLKANSAAPPLSVRFSLFGPTLSQRLGIYGMYSGCDTEMHVLS